MLYLEKSSLMNFATILTGQKTVTVAETSCSWLVGEEESTSLILFLNPNSLPFVFFLPPISPSMHAQFGWKLTSFG